MSVASLYRRPPFLVGDEPAVIRYRRRYSALRRKVQVAFLAAVVLVGLSLRVVGADGLVVIVPSFAVLSTLFVLLHLGAGKRKWMRPVEAYEDGVAASQVTALFCKRRFAAWTDVERLEAEEHVGGPPRLVVHLKGGGRLESAPGEVDAAGIAAMRERLEKAHAEAAAQRALFDAVGSEGAAHG